MPTAQPTNMTSFAHTNPWSVLGEPEEDDEPKDAPDDVAASSATPSRLRRAGRTRPTRASRPTTKRPAAEEADWELWSNQLGTTEVDIW